MTTVVAPDSREDADDGFGPLVPREAVHRALRAVFRDSDGLVPYGLRADRFLTALARDGFTVVAPDSREGGEAGLREGVTYLDPCPICGRQPNARMRKWLASPRTTPVIQPRGYRLATPETPRRSRHRALATNPDSSISGGTE